MDIQLTWFAGKRRRRPEKSVVAVQKEKSIVLDPANPPENTPRHEENTFANPSPPFQFDGFVDDRARRIGWRRRDQQCRWLDSHIAGGLPGNRRSVKHTFALVAKRPDPWPRSGERARPRVQQVAPRGPHQKSTKVRKRLHWGETPSSRDFILGQCHAVQIFRLPAAALPAALVFERRFGYDMIGSLFNVILNLAELALMVSTAFIAPLRMRPRWGWYFTYTVAAGVVWFVASVAGALWWPEPGIGVFILGLISWLFGTFIYIPRILARAEQ